MRAAEIPLAAVLLAHRALFRRLVYHPAFPSRGIFTSIAFRNCDVAVMTAGFAMSQRAWLDAVLADRVFRLRIRTEVVGR